MIFLVSISLIPTLLIIVHRIANKISVIYNLAIAFLFDSCFVLL